MKKSSIIIVQAWRVPNCITMKIKSDGWNSYLSPFGILKKQRKIEASRNKFNKNLNESLFALQVNLCSKLGEIKELVTDENSEEIKNLKVEIESKWGKRNDNKYFEEAHRIIRTSNAYLLRHIWKIEKHYGSQFSVRKINQLMYSILVKLNNGDNSIYLKRKWLQAPAPKCRSLSIPGLTDRIIASMWTEMLELYLRGSMGKENHAYQNSKGTLTAWKVLLEKELKVNWKYIYEFDLANFFPSVSHEVLRKTLLELGIPDWTISMLLKPLLTKPQISLNLEVIDYMTNGPSVFFKSIYEMINYKGEANYAYGKSSLVGVPMGLGYSPLLATLVLIRQLNEWKTLDNSYITYGDDGILFTHDLKDIQKFKNLIGKGRVVLNESKSKFLKKEFIYSGTLKFLGLRWDPFTDRLFAATRKGSKIEMVRYVMDMPVLGQELLRGLWNFYIRFVNLYKIRVLEFENFFFGFCLNHRAAFKFGVFGTLLSKLYQGTYDDLEYEVEEMDNRPDAYLIKEIGKGKWNSKNESTLTIEPMCKTLNSIRKSLKKRQKSLHRIHRTWIRSYATTLLKVQMEEMIPWELGEYVEIYENKELNKIYLRQIGRRNYECILKYLVQNQIDFTRHNVLSHRKIENPEYIDNRLSEEEEDEWTWTYKGFDLVRVRKSSIDFWKNQGY